MLGECVHIIVSSPRCLVLFCLLFAFTNFHSFEPIIIVQICYHMHHNIILSCF
jgi:hypothetical protein